MTAITIHRAGSRHTVANLPTPATVRYLPTAAILATLMRVADLKIRRIPLPDSSHFDSDGNAHMVDVSAKNVSVREALASGDVTMSQSTGEMIRGGKAKKGDVLGIARLAAIQATKLTQQLIPLCHAIPIEAVSVDFQWLEQAVDTTNVLRCLVRVRTTAKTGVEMEAMTAASIGCLTVYDMVKSVDREICIGPVRLTEKSGGKSGDFRRRDV